MWALTPPKSLCGQGGIASRMGNMRDYASDSAEANWGSFFLNYKRRPGTNRALTRKRGTQGHAP
jgi:hypothetical protein